MTRTPSPYFACGVISVFFLWASQTHGQQLRNIPEPNYDETGRPVPPGVPKNVDTNGVLTYINHHFTTPAYQAEALRQLVNEANNVAKELALPEDLPITESNLVTFHVSPFGFAYAFRMIGTITTEKYVYGVAKENKFSDLTIANYDVECGELRDHGRVPMSTFDTNAAFFLATNWLGKLSIDVAGLNRECTPHIAVSPFWNNLGSLGDLPQKQFVPIYYVWWTYAGDQVQGMGGAAGVELYAPTKMLLQISVSDPKYILRNPITFKNLPVLFPGVAPIHTNHPVSTILIDKSLW